MKANRWIVATTIASLLVIGCGGQSGESTSGQVPTATAKTPPMKNGCDSAAAKAAILADLREFERNLNESDIIANGALDVLFYKTEASAPYQEYEMGRSSLAVLETTLVSLCAGGYVEECKKVEAHRQAMIDFRNAAVQAVSDVAVVKAGSDRSTCTAKVRFEAPYVPDAAMEYSATYEWHAGTQQVSRIEPTSLAERRAVEARAAQADLTATYGHDGDFLVPGALLCAGMNAAMRAAAIERANNPYVSAESDSCFYAGEDYVPALSLQVTDIKPLVRVKLKTDGQELWTTTKYIHAPKALEAPNVLRVVTEIPDRFQGYAPCDSGWELGVRRDTVSVMSYCKLLSGAADQKRIAGTFSCQYRENDPEVAHIGLFLEDDGTVTVQGPDACRTNNALKPFPPEDTPPGAAPEAG